MIINLDEKRLGVVLRTLPISNKTLLEDLLHQRYKINLKQLTSYPEIVNEDKQVLNLLNTSMYIKGIEMMKSKLNNYILEQDDDDNDMSNESPYDMEELQAIYNNIINTIDPSDIDAFKNEISNLPPEVQDEILKMYYQDRSTEDQQVALDATMESFKNHGFINLCESIHDLDIKDKNFIINKIYSKVNENEKYNILQSLLNYRDLRDLSLNEAIVNKLNLLIECKNENLNIVNNILESEQHIDFTPISMIKIDKYHYGFGT